MEDLQQQKLKMAQHNVLNMVPQNKRDITRVAAFIVSSVIAGDANPLEIDVKLRYLEELISQVRSNTKMKAEILEEAEKYPEKTFQAYGVEITKTSRGSYDYKSCGDSFYDGVIQELEELNGYRKEREKLLQNLKENLVVKETGEIISPPQKSSTDSIRVKLL